MDAPNSSQVLPAGFVSAEDGTGIVHTTPAWRHNQGLPATAITRGARAEIGRGAFLAQGGRTTMITPAEGAHAFQSRLRRNRSYTGYPPTTRNAVADRARWSSPFRRGVPSHGRAEPNGHNRRSASSFAAPQVARLRPPHRREDDQCPLWRCRL
jgi:hypothetical protein